MTKCDRNTEAPMFNIKAQNLPPLKEHISTIKAQNYKICVNIFSSPAPTHLCQTREPF